MLAAAREAFAEGGESTSLEEIARRAGVGIGTLYRHFPNRQALLEALYVDEVEEVCRSAAELEGARPVGGAQRAGSSASSPTSPPSGRSPPSCSTTSTATRRSSRPAATALFAAGEPLLKRAQEAGVVRPDVEIGEVIQMVVGIAKIPTADPEQTEHILRIALDGLRYQPQA